MKLRLRFPGMVAGSLLSALITLIAVSGVPAAPVPGGFDPAALHRELGSVKAQGLARQWQAQTLRPASVVDVSGYDATYYNIDLNITDVINVQWVYGVVSMRARARVDNYSTPTLDFLSNMTVDSVYSFGHAVTWSHTGNFIYITLDSLYQTGEEFEVTVWYQGHPTEGGFQGFSFGNHLGTPMISTLSEPYMAQSWWPCKDTPSDKADSVDMALTVDNVFYAVSNGVLRDSVDNGNGTTTYRWHEGYPITTYLVSLAITNYGRFDRWYHYGPGGIDSMPVRFYSYPELLTNAQSAWPIAVDQIGVFAGLFGEYPFIDEKYGMAHFVWGGAMEHQTVTSATSSSFGFSQYLIAHELAHQWWGDLITCRDWGHIWLNEGFASYCEALWEESRAGTNAYRNYMNGMAYYGSGRIYIDDTTSVGNIFSSRVYDKGAWVLHMLRGVVGDSAFFATLRAYYSDPNYRYKDAVTEDFRDVAATVSGINLDEFFNDWIYGYYYPKYAYSWMAEPRTDNFYNVYVHLRQTQATSPSVFDMPVDVRLDGVGGTPVYRVWNTQREQDYLFVTSSPPTGITIDPDGWILKTLVNEGYTLNIVSDSIHTGARYFPYSDSLIVRGGTPPYEYVLAAGTLPSGLSFDSTTGIISGTPMVTDTVLLTLGVWDAGHVNYRSRDMTLTVVSPPYLPGDQNGDGLLDAVDLSELIDYVFFNGPPPVPVNAADLNGDCQADVVDINYLVQYIFFGGAFPLPGCIQ